MKRLLVIVIFVPFFIYLEETSLDSRYKIKILTQALRTRMDELKVEIQNVITGKCFKSWLQKKNFLNKIKQEIATKALWYYHSTIWLLRNYQYFIISLN